MECKETPDGFKTGRWIERFVTSTQVRGVRCARNLDCGKVQLRAGRWYCPEHGEVRRPWQQVVPACPDCGRAVHKGVYQGGMVVTVEPAPSHCAGPDRHPLAAGRASLGTAACSCSPTGIHRTWTCAECGDVQQWPEHRDVDAAPFFGPGSGQ